MDYFNSFLGSHFIIISFVTGESVEMDGKATQNVIFWMLIYTKILRCVGDQLIINNCSDVPLFDPPFKISSYPAYRIFPFDETTLNTLNKENISPECKETLMFFSLDYSNDQRWTIQCKSNHHQIRLTMDR